MSLVASEIDLSARTQLVLEDHQREAVGCVLEAWSDADRVTVVMACGTGKTIVGLAAVIEAVKSSGATNVGIFVPSLGLIKQTIQVWREFQPWGEQFRVIAVCSDPGVEADDIPPDEIPAVVTTNAGELARFIGDAPSDAVNVIFSTYHSAGVVADSLAETGFPLDIGIADEAHNTAGSADKAFGLMLREEALPIRKRLFMTATPRIIRQGKGEFTSMDDDAFYGQVVYNLSFREAVARGIICDWEVLISVITRDDAAAYSLARAVYGLSGQRLQEAAGRAAIAKAIESVGVRKAISFHNTILASRDFAQDELSNRRAMPGFNVYHVNGADKAGRHEAMQAFANAEKAIVSNARCLTEGVDIPAVDLIAFLGRKSSKIDIVQAIGRALRTAPGKTKGYILLPVLLDPRSGQTPGEALADSDLTTVWDVLAAMRDNDELFAENVSQAGRGFGGREGTSLLSPEWVTIVGDVDLEAIRKGIEVIALDELLFPFDHGFRRLAEFVSREGHAKVPAPHVEADGFKLGSWVSARRQDYRAGRLSVERIAALEAMPSWVWSVLDEGWEKGLDALRAFAAREGHAKVPTSHVEADGFKLGSWVSTRRKDYRDGSLPAERIAAVEAMPGWVWNPLDDSWEKGLDALRAFAAREGHAKVPKSRVEPDGFKLGSWVSTRRTDYRDGSLPAERIAAVEAMPGWVWDTLDDSWEKWLDALRAFAAREGHAKVPAPYVEPDGFRLGNWVSARRKDYRDGSLPAERIAVLEAMPGWVWNPLDDSWEKGLDALRAFAAREGHAKVPKRHIEANGLRLGTWVSTRRVEYLEDRLPMERIAALETVPGWVWSVLDEGWERGMDVLRAFAAREGHAKVPDKHVEADGFRLGSWVSDRRKDYRAGRLPVERIAALETVPSWVWSVLDEGWEKGLDALRAFAAREGHAKVPTSHVEADGFRLGSWVSDRRKDYRVGRLPAKRISALETVPGWAWAARSDVAKKAT